MSNIKDFKQGNHIIRLYNSLFNTFNVETDLFFLLSFFKICSLLIFFFGFKRKFFFLNCRDNTSSLYLSKKQSLK